MAKSGWREVWACYARSRGHTLRWTGWMLLATAGVMFALGLTYVSTARALLDWSSGAFLLLGLFGQFLLLAFLVYVPLVVLALLVPRRVAVSVSVLAYGALALLVLIDTRVFAIYRFHLNARVWHLLTSGVASDVLPLTQGFWLLLAGYLAALVGGMALLGYAVARWLRRRPSRSGWAVAPLAVLLVLSGHVIHAWADANQVVTITRVGRFIPWDMMTRAGEFFKQHGWAAGETAPLAAPSGGILRYPLAPLTCARPSKPPNVVVILIDGWRLDFVTPEISPSAHALAQRSWRFERHFSTANETRYGVFGLMYGLNATYWDDMVRERRGTVLIDQLLAAGYRLGQWGGAPLNHPEFDLTVFAAVRENLTLRLPGDAAWQRDREMTRRFAEFLDVKDPSPFFAFLFYDSTHEYSHDPAMAPFQPEVQGYWFTAPPESRDPVPIRNRFANAAHYADHLIGQALAKLKATGHQDDTVILITGDHGEEFNDSGQNYWGHAGGGMTRWQLQTPLIVHWPGRKPQSFRHRTSHVDVVPTLMRDVLGCTTPYEAYSHGRHLLDASPRPYLVAYNGIRLAVLEPDRTTVIFEYGGTDIVDDNFRIIPGAVPRPDIIRDVLRETSQFYWR